MGPGGERNTARSAGPSLEDLLNADDEYTDIGDQETKNSERSQTIEALIDYYGGQQFYYGGHVGTIIEIIELCPAVGVSLDQGFDAVVRFVSGCEITSEEAERRRNPQKGNVDEEINAAKDDAIEGADKETSGVQSVEPSVHKRENSTKRNSYSTTAPQLGEQLSSNTEAAETGAEGSIENKKLVAIEVTDVDSNISKREMAEIINPEATTIEKTESTKEAAIIPEIVVNHEVVQQPEGSDVTTQNEVEEIHPTPLPAPFETFLEPPEYTTRENAMELADVREKDIGAFQLPPLDMTEFEQTPHDISEFIIDDPGASQTDSAEQLREFEPVMTDTNETALTTLEDVFVADTIIEHGSETAVSPMDVFERTQQIEDRHVEMSQELVIETVADFVGEAPPVYEYEYTLLRNASVEVIEKIELLEQAKTAEECSERLQEIHSELQALLELLGYEDAERIARRLVSQYDTKILKQFIANLLQSFSALELPLPSAVSTSILPHHHWFGQRVVEKLVKIVPLGQFASV